MPSSTTDRVLIRPALYADAQGQQVLSAISASQRKAMGQFFTPLAVADFMASLLVVSREHVRILDPGAGSGVLACAACEHLVAQPDRPRSIHLDAYEADPVVARALENVLAYLKEWLGDCGTTFTYRTRSEDFVAANADALRSNGALWSEGAQVYDLVIANPPYFKVSKSSHYAQVAADIVHGQPNIYSIFMAASAALLEDAGRIVVICPRSFASGAYFRRFRQVFFNTVRPQRVHLFGSRRNAFDRDSILQEWLILSAVREPGWHDSADATESAVEISSSTGTDDIHRAPRSVPIHRVLDMHSPHAYFRVPLERDDDLIVDIVDSWGESLASLGLAVSTGRVVPFRAREYLRHEPGSCSVPLLWMNNVAPMTVSWPLGNHKPEFFVDSPDSRTRLLVPNQDYLLLRRFSSKEQARRLVAAPLDEGALGHEWLGFENHLNYVYFTGSQADRVLLHGLAVLLNSSLLDRYFRILNGNTEVSATELRSMPLPEAHVLVELGRRWQPDMDSRDLDDLIEETLTTVRGAS